MNKDTVIIVAGGSGNRMQSAIPKQFLPLNGLPVIMHSINAFVSFKKDIEVIIALPENYFIYWKEICAEYDFIIKHTLSKGGSTRFETVKNALKLTGNKGLVAIHDAVRPLVSLQTIDLAFRRAGEKGNAIPVIPVVDSVRQTSGESNKPVDRTALCQVQTPQVFRKELIKKAYETASHGDYSDDATVLESMGEKIWLVEGNIENIKITYLRDLRLAELIMNGEQI